MTEDPRPTRPNAPGGPMSERMQALLSRAAEEQLTEQRQVSAVLADLRGLVANLGEQLRGTASSARLESLGGDVSSLFTELRMSTSALGERLDVLARRVDEQAASATEMVTAQGSGSEALAVRVSGLAEDLSSQSTALDRLTDSVGVLAAFPDALAALQREVSGLHDRLTPLGDVRTGLADLVARTGAIEALRPEVGAVSARMEGLATSDEVAGSRDALVSAVSAVTERLDRLEGLADRPGLTQEALDASLAPLLARLDEVGSGGQVVDRLGGLDDRLSALEVRLGEVAERLSDVSDAAGGVPAVATDLHRMAGRLDEVAALRADVLATREAVLAAQDDSPVPSLVLGVAALREDVEDLGSRVSEVTVPTAEAVATAVGQQVTDRLVDELAPRVADVVLTRVAATLVEQVSGSVAASVQNGLTEKVRAATADSERRISAHVDEAVLALAEALLRRRRGTRSGGGAPLGAGELDMPVPVDPAPSAAVEIVEPAQGPEGTAEPRVLPEGVPAVDVRPEGLAWEPAAEDLVEDPVEDPAVEEPVQAAADEAPAGEGPADEGPADEGPADEGPADEGPADEARADEARADEARADEARADEGPIEVAFAPEQELAAQDAEAQAAGVPLRNIDIGGEGEGEAPDSVIATMQDADVPAAEDAAGPVSQDESPADAQDEDDEQDDALAAASAAAAADLDLDLALDQEAAEPPAGPPAEAPAFPTSTAPERIEPAAVAPTQSVVPAPQWHDGDEDDEDGPPRRPWWRPGG